MVNDSWKVENGGLESGKRKLGKWKLESGKWKLENGN